MKQTCRYGRLSYIAALFFSVIAGTTAARAQNDQIFQQPITVVGRALDTNGDPVANASIYLASVRNQQRLIGNTTTNKNGEFEFKDVDLPCRQPDSVGSIASGVFEVFGTAKGYGFAWRSEKWYYPDGMPDFGGRPNEVDGIRHFAGKQPIKQDLTFEPAACLSGQVVDDNDQPIPNASVVLFDAEPVPANGYESSSSFYTVQSNAFSALYLSHVIPGEMRQRFSDEDGRFSFDEAPRNAEFRIFVKPPGFAKQTVYASTSTPDKYRFKDQKIEFDGMKLVFSKVRRVPIRVIYGDTRKPAKNVRVNLSRKEASQSSVTNADGMAVLSLPPGNYKVSYLTEHGTPYVSRYSVESILQHTVPETDERELEIWLEPAAVVEIEVVDAHIGKPIPGADIWIRGGDFHHDYRWRSWKPPNISMFENPRTNADGKMRLFLVPGTYVIGAGNQHMPAKYASSDNGVEQTVKLGNPQPLKLKLKRRGVR